MIQEMMTTLLKRQALNLHEISIEEVRIGKNLCAVRLSNGAYGVSSVIDDPGIHCTKDKRDFGDFTPLQIRGKSIYDLFTSDKTSATVAMLRVAAIQAVSSVLPEDPMIEEVVNKDPIDLLNLTEGSRVILVGAFQSYIDRCIAAKCDLGVLELNPQALREEHQSYYLPAGDFQKVIPSADQVIITGLSIVNQTIDPILKAAHGLREVVVTGPSSNVYPEFLFHKGVTMIGGMKITRPDVLMNLVSEGAAGYHLYQYCAVKTALRKHEA